jgi:hypothetical protein
VQPRWLRFDRFRILHGQDHASRDLKPAKAYCLT